jgi:Trypsin-co-occurring domain 1
MYRIIGHYASGSMRAQLGGDKMTNYLQFASEEGEAADVLVEVDAAEDFPMASEENAGLLRRAGEAVAVAQSGFEQAVRRAVRLNVRAFLAAADALEKPPAEMEITFGLKATGEVGNLAVGKVAGESNYQIKMVWRRSAGE